MSRFSHYIALGDLIEIKHGFAFKSEFFSAEGPYYLLTPGNFREGGATSILVLNKSITTGRCRNGSCLNLAIS
jgi:hypothetical protein